MSKREISPPRTRSRRRQRFGSLSDNDVAITPVNDTSPLQPRRLEANKSAQQSSPQRSPNTEKRLKESERRMLVSVRCRPLSRSEVASGCLEVVRPFVESQTVVISKQGKSGGVLRSERGAEHEYCFDQVFGALSTNEQVYAAAASHLVADVLKGINCTIFAYGATGAGKTHTMLGSDGGTGKGPSNEDRGGVGDPGVIARAMVDIFKGVEEARQAHADGGVDEVDADVGPMSPLKSVKNSVKGSRVKRRRSGISQGDVVMKAEWRVSVSFLEVYNETIYDLLTTEKQKPLIPCEDPTDQSVNVLGLTQTEVGSTDDVLALLRQGNARRKMEPTAANQVSSRSHAVLQVTIDFIRELRTPGRRLLKVVKRSSRLSMIDLAGSERAAATSNLGARLREGANINKSLLALANCINALSSREKGKKGGAPTRVKYRDSKLTHLLKSSLEGKCRVSMIANINPSNQSYEESHNTLKYANRAKAIKVTASSKGNRVTRMDSPNDERIAELRAQNQELRQQLVLTQRKAKRQEYEHGKQARRFDGDGTGVREEEEGDLENVPFRMNVGPPLPPLQLYPEDGEQDDSDAAETPSRMEDGNNGGYDVRDMMSTPFLPHSCGASTAAGTSGNTNTTASGRRRKRKVNETETAHGGGRRSNKMSNRAVATKRRANSNTGEDEDVLMSPPPEYASYRSNNNASPINSGRESRGKRVSPRVTAVGSGGTAGGGVSVAEARQLKRRIAELENQTNADLRKFAQKQRELKAQISSLSKENTRLVKEATAVKVSGCVYACVCLCVCVCMYVCMYACMYVRIYIYVCMFVYICMFMYACLYVSTYVPNFVCVCIIYLTIQLVQLYCGMIENQCVSCGHATRSVQSHHAYHQLIFCSFHIHACFLILNNKGHERRTRY
jgi:hypothetical protein